MVPGFCSCEVGLVSSSFTEVVKVGRESKFRELDLGCCKTWTHNWIVIHVEGVDCQKCFMKRLF